MIYKYLQQQIKLPQQETLSKDFYKKYPSSSLIGIFGPLQYYTQVSSILHNFGE